MDTLRLLIFRPLLAVSEKSSLLETSQSNCRWHLSASTNQFDGSHPSFDKKKSTDKRRCFLVEGDGFEPSKQDATDLQSAPFGHSGTPPYSIEKVELVMGLEPATC